MSFCSAFFVPGFDSKTNHEIKKFMNKVEIFYKKVI